MALTPSPQQDSSKWLIIPMEIVERELSGNLLLCTEAIKNGWNCILGTKRTVVDALPDLPKGVVFMKSIVTSDIHNIKKFRSAGHRLVCLDVEGLVYTSMEEFVSCRFAEETLREVDHLFFWGDIQCEAVKKTFPAHAAKCHTTGSPIADLWHKEYLHAVYTDEVDILRQRFGKYILIPSSFGTANHFLGHGANLDIIMRDKMVKEEEKEAFCAFWNEYENHLLRIFKAHLALLPKLSAAFPDHKIIVRPHPAESHDTWKEAAAGLSNVEVIFEGAVSPWLLGADAILHYGCTTGLEGYLMHRPVVAYNPSTPEENAKFDHKLPHSISVIATTEDDTISKLRHVMAHPDAIEKDFPNVAQGKAELAHWLHKSSQGASAEIMAYLEQMNIARQLRRQVHQTPVPFREHIWALLGILLGSPRLRPYLPDRIRIGIESRSYGRHKSRAIDEVAVQKLLTVMADITEVDEIKAEKLARNLFYIGR